MLRFEDYAVSVSGNLKPASSCRSAPSVGRAEELSRTLLEISLAAVLRGAKTLFSSRTQQRSTVNAAAQVAQYLLCGTRT